MYEIVKNALTEDNISSLKSIMGSVDLTEGHVRLGTGGFKKRSVFKQSKWLEWDRETKNDFKSNLPQKYVNDSLIGWFLHIPKEVGFHDEQDFWAKAPMAGTVVSFALEDNMKIIINGKEIQVPKGHGVKFNLRNVHEIKKQPTDQNWACLMILE